MFTRTVRTSQANTLLQHTLRNTSSVGTTAGLMSPLSLTDDDNNNNNNSVVSRGYAKKAQKADTYTFQVIKPHVTYLLEDHPPIPLEVEVSKDDALFYLRRLLTMRRMEMEADQLYKKKLIRGFCHLYIGQEAVATGMAAALNLDDHIITAYRCHGWQMVKGDSVKAIIAELMGREAGSSNGKGGSMHIYKTENNFYGGNGIVGAQVPLGAGLAFQAQYEGTGQIAVALYGDGAANQGQIFEAYNMAGLWKLPIAFVCENNHYGMGTSIQRASAETQFYKRGQYIPGIQFDGMDVIAVQAATQYAADYIRAGNGPLVMEANTYRYVGHSMSDPGNSYRSREEVDNIRKSMDCIELMKSRILEAKFATEDEIKSMEKEVRKDVTAQVKEALASPEPKVSEYMFQETVINNTEALRGTEQWHNGWKP